MPWSGSEFKKRHAKHLTDAQAAKAASMANAMIKGGTPEGESIATAIKHAKKKSHAETLYPKKD